MISKRTKTSLLSALLAIPPVLLIATFVSKMLPTLEPVSSVVAANDPKVSGLQSEARSSRPYYALQAR